MSGKNILPLYQSDIKNDNANTAGPSSGSSSNIPQQQRELQLVVRFSNGLPDVVIPVTMVRARAVSASFIRQEIRRQHRPETYGKRLKMVHNGKVLSNHTNMEKEIKEFIKFSDDSDNGPIKLYIHCLIGDDLTPEEIEKEEELDKQPEQSTSEAPRGFDRLLSQGFSQQDVLELRNQFVSIHGASLRSQTEDAIRDLEDRWIDSTVNNEIDEFTQNGVAGGNGEGTLIREDSMNFEMLYYVCMGFLLGIFALFLLRLKVSNIDRRSEMALMFGVFVNISYGCAKLIS